MKEAIIDYSPAGSEFSGAVMVAHIVHLTKTSDNEKTLIHLTTGGVLVSDDSIKTLTARINIASRDERT